MKKILRVLRGNIFRYAAWMVSGAATQAATAFVANLLLVRILLPEDFGRFAIVLANIGLVQTLVSIPIGTLVLRTPKEELEERLSLYAAANIVQNLFCFIVALLVLSSTGKLDSRSFLLLASTLSTNWISMQMNLYERRFQYKKLSMLETAAHFSGHLFAVTGVLCGLGSIVLYGRELVRQLNLILGLKLIGGLRSIPLRWLTIKDWRELFRQVRGFWMDGFLESSFGRLVILTVGLLSGESGAGYFFQAQRLAILPHQFLQPITQRIAVNYFSHRTAGHKRATLLAKTLGFTALSLGLTATVMGLISPWAIPIVLGEIWQPVVPVFMAMLGFIMSATLFNLLKSYFIADARMRTLIVVGRTWQYASFSCVAMWVYFSSSTPEVGLGIGLSAAYLTATLSLMAKLWSESVLPFKFLESKK